MPPLVSLALGLGPKIRIYSMSANVHSKVLDFIQDGGGEHLALVSVYPFHVVEYRSFACVQGIAMSDDTRSLHAESEITAPSFKVRMIGTSTDDTCQVCQSSLDLAVTWGVNGQFVEHVGRTAREKKSKERKCTERPILVSCAGATDPHLNLPLFRPNSGVHLRIRSKKG